MVAIILAGFQGVGKTTCGRLLARLLNVPFIDTDEKFFPSARAVYEVLGEEEFRKKELGIIQEIPLDTPKVIALGGGSLTTHEAQKTLATMGKLIYLYLPLTALLQNPDRFMRGRFLEKQSFVEHFYERHATFTAICHSTINIENLEQKQVVEKICEVAVGK